MRHIVSHWGIEWVIDSPNDLHGSLCDSSQVARLEVDLDDRSCLLDQVISKWTAAVASFTMHREGDPSCPCGDCTLNRNAGATVAAPQQPTAPPTPEQHQAKERKKRRCGGHDSSMQNMPSFRLASAAVPPVVTPAWATLLVVLRTWPANPRPYG